MTSTTAGWSTALKGMVGGQAHVALPSPIPVADLLALLDRACLAWRTEEAHSHGQVAPLADNRAADEFYALLAGLAADAARGLRVDTDRVNHVYGKRLRYEPGRGPLGWHCDTDAEGLDEGLRRGLVERWQYDEMRGRTLSCSVQLTHPGAYDGGRLLVRADDGLEVTAPLELGTFVFFASDRQHSVTEEIGRASCRERVSSPV